MRSQGHEVVDFGTNSEAACDYPEFAALVANAVRSDVGSVGVLVCATGHGTAIAAGKVRGIRAFAPTSVEAARLSRFDNNTNVPLPRRPPLGRKRCLRDRRIPWLSTGFAGGRHGRRIAKISAMETAAPQFSRRERVPSSCRQEHPGQPLGQRTPLLSHPPAARAKHQPQPGLARRPQRMERELAGITAFADQVRKAGFRRAVLVGTGGSALPAEVLARIFGPAAGWLNVFVLDCTDPAAVAAVETSIDPERTLFVVASKVRRHPRGVRAGALLLGQSVATVRTATASRAGQHFAAITDAGTELDQTSLGQPLPSRVQQRAAITSRFSAAGPFGLVPAALMA